MDGFVDHLLQRARDHAAPLRPRPALAFEQGDDAPSSWESADADLRTEPTQRRAALSTDRPLGELPPPPGPAPRARPPGTIAAAAYGPAVAPPDAPATTPPHLASHPASAARPALSPETVTGTRQTAAEPARPAPRPLPDSAAAPLPAETAKTPAPTAAAPATPAPVLWRTVERALAPWVPTGPAPRRAPADRAADPPAAPREARGEPHVIDAPARQPARPALAELQPPRNPAPRATTQARELPLAQPALLRNTPATTAPPAPRPTDHRDSALRTASVVPRPHPSQAPAHLAAAPMAAASEGPTVHVTIGRVEIRAVVAAAAPAPAPRRAAAAKPALSLADYLQRRQGGPR